MVESLAKCANLRERLKLIKTVVGWQELQIFDERFKLLWDRASLGGRRSMPNKEIGVQTMHEEQCQQVA